MMKFLKCGEFVSATILILILAASAQAQTIAQWTFETSQPSGSPGAGNYLTNIAAEVGSGTGSGWHAGASTYSTPVGDGSVHSFSSSLWAVGDFYQFDTSTVGYSGIRVEWDQASSGTGPGFGHLQYSTDGNTFTPFGSDYSIVVNATPNAWSSATYNPLFHYTVDLSSVTALNNDSTVWFRLVDPNTTSANGGTVGTAGTDRVDNFTVEVVPEPHSLALLGGFGILAWNFVRRRK